MAEFSVRIPDDLDERIKEIARRQLWSKNTTVVVLLQKAVERWIVENREQKK